MSRPPPRVLHLGTLYPPHIVGGAERSVSMLAEAQAKSGWQVAAACLSPNGWSRETRNGVSVFRMPHENSFWMEDWPSQSQLRREWAKFRQQANFAIERHFGRVLDEFAPDLVNTHSMVDVSTRVWRAAHRRGVPIVHTLRDYDLLCAASSMYRESGPCAGRHLKCRVLTFTKQFDQKLVTSVTAVGGEILRRHLDYGFFDHVPASRRCVIWNTAELEGVTDEYRRPGRTGPFTIGYLGRLSPEKGVDVLLDAIRTLRAGDWRVRIAGVAPPGQEARFHALAAGLPVDFMGFVKPKELFEQIDVLVTPSVWAEPLGRSVLEAYRVGVPVIGSDSGGIAEIVADPDWLFAPGDAAALARVLTRVMSAGRSGLPPATRFKSVVARTRPEAVATAFAEVYADVLRPAQVANA